MLVKLDDPPVPSPTLYDEQGRSQSSPKKSDAEGSEEKGNRLGGTRECGIQRHDLRERKHYSCRDEGGPRGVTGGTQQGAKIRTRPGSRGSARRRALAD